MCESRDRVIMCASKEDSASKGNDGASLEGYSSDRGSSDNRGLNHWRTCILIRDPLLHMD